MQTDESNSELLLWPVGDESDVVENLRRPENLNVLWTELGMRGFFDRVGISEVGSE